MAPLVPIESIHCVNGHDWMQSMHNYCNWKLKVNKVQLVHNWKGTVSLLHSMASIRIQQSNISTFFKDCIMTVRIDLVWQYIHESTMPLLSCELFFYQLYKCAQLFIYHSTIQYLVWHGSLFFMTSSGCLCRPSMHKYWCETPPCELVCVWAHASI
jgi:hypothetical protein